MIGLGPVIAAEKVNIVYILADDLGYGDLGCYGQGKLASPHIDQLAREGVLFTEHYAGNSVCTPSRSSLLTGMHPGHVRHRGNPTFANSYGFLPNQLTFGDVLRSAGYATAITGKWHVGDRADTKDMAHHHGFDFAFCGGFPYPEGKIEHWPSHIFVNGVMTPIPENQNGKRGKFMDDLYTDAALQFIESNKSRPFALFLSFQSVHAPMDGEIAAKFADNSWPAVEKIFASMHERMDENVGRVLDALARLHLTENTVVFFSSDNGPHHEGGHSPAFFNSSGGLRGGKRDLYEGGVRVPLIVRWPGIVKPNTKSDQICAFWDVLPTFAEIGGAATPKGLDGLSIVPSLRGLPQTQHEYLYWETSEEGGKQAVRMGNWKGVRLNVTNKESSKFSLYDLRSDLHEKKDVSAEHPDIVKRIAQIASEAHVPSPLSPLLPGEHAAPVKASKEASPP